MPHKIPTTQLRKWYVAGHRRLPWRAPPGQRGEPYHVWLSEIMLQQTIVVTVVPYFDAFLKKWPTVTALADADLQEVLVAWQGLGYYARARNLHKCATVIRDVYRGVFPESPEAIRALPGVGPYTANAIRALAFGHPVIPVDGNIERITARLFAITAPLPGAKKLLAERAQALDPGRYPGDVAQALMDLGARICVPRTPKCGECVLRMHCRAHATGIAGGLPRKAPKKPRPEKFGTAFWLQSEGGKVWLRKRPEKGLLGGMTEVPSTPWETQPDTDPGKYAPASCDWTPLNQQVRHIFTHFGLTLTVWTGYIPENHAVGAEGFWVPLDRLATEPLPTLMKKVAAAVAGASIATPP